MPNRKMVRYTVSLLFMWAVLAGLTPDSHAQGTTATILGTVQDETGAVVPAVEITVQNIETGISRTVYSSTSGVYRAPQLAPGDYEVRAELPGFEVGIRRGIILTVGREAVVDFQLRVGEVTQSIEVTGDAPMIQTNSSEIGGIIDEEKMRDLPLNGRDFSQLMLLETGVVQQKYAVQSPNTGGGTRVSVGGQRMDYNNFIIDGTRKNELGGTTTGSVAGVQLGVDALQEFRILTHNYSAEFGQTAGAIITAVTRAGTNAFHGSGFYFHRNDEFDARNFFDKGAPPEFKRNQFGGSGGGPIFRDRTFFFGAYEGLRERRGLTNTAFVPTLAARQGLLTDPVTGGPLTVAPEVQPFLDLYPLPNGPDLGGGAGIHTFAFSEPRNEDFFSVRVDHQLSDRDSLFARYQFSDADRAEPRQSGVFSDVIESRQQMITFQEMHIFSPTVVHSLTLGFNRANPTLNSVSSIPIDPALVTGPGRTIPRFRISEVEGAAVGSGGGAISELGPRSLDGGQWTTNSYQIKNDLNYIRGNHAIKVGTYVERLQYNIFQADLNGTMNFGSLASFLQGRPSSFTIEDPNSARAWRQTIVGMYAQDDVRLLPSLTLNLGLRWEMATAHKDAFGRNAVVHDQLAPGTQVLDSLFSPGMKNFAPRVGFAWDVLGDGRTSLRGGAGIFHNLITGRSDLIGLSRTPPFGGTSRATNPPFVPSEAAQAAVSGGRPRVNAWPRSLAVPTVYHYNLNLERQLIFDTVARVGYVGSHGSHLNTQRSGNTAIPEIRADGSKFFPAGSPVRNPNLGTLSWFDTAGNSFYNAVELSVNRRSSRGVRFQLSYTFSKSVDDQSSLVGADNLQGGGFLLDPDDTQSSRGRSINDQTHNFVSNFGYELPVGPGQLLNVQGPAAKVLGGWQLNGIVTAASGVPFTPIVGFNRARNGDNRSPDRPNLVAGRSNDPVLGDPNLWFDPTAFSLPDAGTFGNLGRGTVESPGLLTFDFSVFKNTPVTEKVNVEFRAEFFNLFNRANFALPQANLFERNGERIGNAGRITSTVTTPREIQFGLKFLF